MGESSSETAVLILILKRSPLIYMVQIKPVWVNFLLVLAELQRNTIPFVSSCFFWGGGHFYCHSPLNSNYLFCTRCKYLTLRNHPYWYPLLSSLSPFAGGLVNIGRILYHLKVVKALKGCLPIWSLLIVDTCWFAASSQNNLLSWWHQDPLQMIHLSGIYLQVLYTNWKAQWDLEVITAMIIYHL